MSGASVGALCARAARRGALLNVRINLAGYANPEDVDEKLAAGRRMAEEAEQRERQILSVVEQRMG